MHEMKKQVYPELEETLYAKVLENGLTIYFVPKPGFRKVFCTFATKFGAIDVKFVPMNEKEYIEVPTGVAHFLEHKMFEMPDGTDATNLLAQYGADANAYTDYNQTAYVVSLTSHFKEVLNILLDYVQTPYFTDENVKKEQGIIIQEYKMYQDMPRDRLYTGLMKNLFAKNLHREDVVGTETSIRSITKEILYQCYHTFYHPSNMYLCIVGDIDPDETLKWIEENQSQKKFSAPSVIKRIHNIESSVVYKKSGSCKMDIVMPKVSVALKLPCFDFEEDELLELEYKIKIILEHTFGITSPVYQDLLDKELISGFSYSCTIDETSGYVRISTNTFKEKEFISYITKELLSLSHFTISDDDLKEIKKAIQGSFIRSLNNVEFISTTFVEYKLKNCNIFHTLDIIQKMKKEELEELGQYFVKEAITSFSVLPKVKKATRL